MCAGRAHDWKRWRPAERAGLRPTRASSARASWPRSFGTDDGDTTGSSAARSTGRTAVQDALSFTLAMDSPMSIRAPARGRPCRLENGARTASRGPPAPARSVWLDGAVNARFESACVAPAPPLVTLVRNGALLLPIGAETSRIGQRPGWLAPSMVHGDAVSSGAEVRVTDLPGPASPAASCLTIRRGGGPIGYRMTVDVQASYARAPDAGSLVGGLSTCRSSSDRLTRGPVRQR